MKKYEDRWDWTVFGLGYWPIPCTNALFEKFHPHWDLDELSMDETLPWSIEMIEKHEDRWDWSELIHNYGLCKEYLMPIMSDQIIEAVMKKI